MTKNEKIKNGVFYGKLTKWELKNFETVTEIRVCDKKGKQIYTFTKKPEDSKQ